MKRNTQKLAIIQPFSLGDKGGGARILRSICAPDPSRLTSFVSRYGAVDIEPIDQLDEYHVPLRPSLGRIERTRFAYLADVTEFLFGRPFRRRLKRLLSDTKPSTAHLIPHSWGDFRHAAIVLREMNIPTAVSIHDDIRFTAARHPFRAQLEDATSQLWNHAYQRFVISTELGDEYNRRYGPQHYDVHTDGQAIQQVSASRKPSGDPVRIYFMGLFNNGYAENLRLLISAIRSDPELDGKFEVYMRCGSLPLSANELPGWLTILPFAEETVVREDLKSASLLYLPLPFAKDSALFSLYSFSTKFITYLSSGLPILYHGPPDSALGRYIQRNDVAFTAEEPSISSIRTALRTFLADSIKTECLRNNALEACRRDFDPEMLYLRFWNGIDSTDTQ